MAINFEDYNFTDLHNYPNVGFNNKNELTEFQYEGNHYLRPWNTKLILSPEAIQEREKCKNDIQYFIEKWCRILTLDKGITNIKLRKYQKKFLKILQDERFIISMQSRRAGKTTVVALYIIHNIEFNKDYQAGISANTAKLTSEIVRMIQQIYELLPPFLQSGIKKWNASTIELANGSRVLSAVIGGSAHRGGALNFLFVDEVAFCDANKYSAFEDSVLPTLQTSDKTKICKVSTPNGFNHFQKDWADAKDGKSGYTTFIVTWHDIDFYTEEWAKAEIKRKGIMYFNQNYACSFINSSKTLLDSNTIANIIRKEPINEDYLYPDVKLYKEFNENNVYVATLDSSKTVGKIDAENDYLCYHVLELGKDKIEQVLTYRVNDIHYLDMSKIIYEIGETFNFPWIIIENNEGSGQSIADTLKDTLEYPNVYCDPAHDGLIAGIRTTANNRPIGLQSLKKLIDNDILILNNDDTIDEFFTFIKIGKKYQASSNSTDDCVMSLNLLMYFLMDDLNELEITLKDYLNDTVNIVKDTSEEDVNFFVGMNEEEFKQYQEAKWLLEGKDF